MMRKTILVLLALSVFGMLLACETVTSFFAGGTPQAQATGVPKPKVTSTSSRPTPRATATPVEAPAISQGAACFGSGASGTTCLDSAGWHPFTEKNPPPISIGWVKDIVTCPDGKVRIAAYSSLTVTDGRNWEEVGSPLSTEALACDATSGVWVAGSGGVSYYDGEKWTAYKSDQFGSGKYVNQIQDVAVASNGRVWVVTSDSVAMFDGKTWTAFEEGKGFNKKYYFNSIAVDSQGQVWVGHSAGIVMFDGKTWTVTDFPQYKNIQSLAVDSKDHLWVGTTSGVFMSDGKSWTNYNRKNNSLSSDGVQSVAVDSQDRVWVGTEWGLNVFDGSQWQVYHMHNSDLVDNGIAVVGVIGKGPPVPALMKKTPGSLTGRIVRGTQPADGVNVEICSDFIGGSDFFGTTPCSGQSFSRAAKTDNNGKFVFDDLPVGRYYLTFQVSEEKWLYQTDGFIAAERIMVNEGKSTDVGNLQMGSR